MEQHVRLRTQKAPLVKELSAQLTEDSRAAFSYNVRFFLMETNVRLYRITLNVKVTVCHANPPSRL